MILIAACNIGIVELLGLEIGEVWANMLHNVYAALVDKHGYSQDAMTNPSGNGGNVIFMHLFIRSLIYVPCYADCGYLNIV